MNKFKIVKSLALLAAGGLLVAGCETRVYGPGGGVAVATEPAGAEVEVAGPPPAPMDDVVVGVAPGPDYIWVGGDWGWVGNRWAWHGGHWDRPPHAGAHWDRGHYEYRNGRHVYHRGGWH
jgi:hypothetical protein